MHHIVHLWRRSSCFNQKVRGPTNRATNRKLFKYLETVKNDANNSFTKSNSSKKLAQWYTSTSNHIHSTSIGERLHYLWLSSKYVTKLAMLASDTENENFPRQHQYSLASSPGSLSPFKRFGEPGDEATVQSCKTVQLN